MTDFNRRSLLKGGATAAGAAALSAASLGEWAKAWAQTAPWKAEPGATINLLRWKRFVQGEEDAFVKIVAAFEKATGAKITVTNESFDDIQPKASVSANTGVGPDIVWPLHVTPHLFPDKLLEMTDVAEYLGKKYGGWVPVAEAYGKSKDKWICIPVAVNGGYINYRIKAVKDAGFSTFPDKTDGLLELCKALKAKGTPAGFALGHASGDANAWLHWLLWSHGAFLVDKDDKVIINSPETAKAMEYCKALSDTFIPGCASWNDSSNNKAYLSGELFLTANGISIYAAAKASGDAKQLAIADDTDHAFFPLGPSGKPAELQLAFPLMVFKYTKFPNASKAFAAFMLEAEQFNPWLEGAAGYLTHCLNAYDSNPVWTADAKRAPFREAAKRTLPISGLGTIGEKAATAVADFIVVDMFANYCTGREDLKGAIAQAERQTKRIYR
jgi:multiple sugar transport system substrate-binding protein